jgi:hypothetical protein
MPEIPAVSETVAGYEAEPLVRMWGRKHCRAKCACVERRSRECNCSPKTPKIECVQKDWNPGVVPPEQFQQIVRRDTEKWRKVIREAKITRADWDVQRARAIA